MFLRDIFGNNLAFCGRPLRKYEGLEDLLVAEIAKHLLAQEAARHFTDAYVVAQVVRAAAG